MFRDPVITLQKNFDNYYRSGARLLVQRVKSHKLTLNACQVTFSFKFDAITVPILTTIVCDQQHCKTFQSNNSINILKIAKLYFLSKYEETSKPY